MQPFTATVRNDRLTLEIEAQQFLADALGDPRHDLVIVDPQRFLGFVGEHLFTLTHDVDETGATPSWWTRLSQALALAAAEANQGVRRRTVIEPTCGCDPEEHDGG